MYKRLGTIMIVFMLLSGCGKQEEPVEQVSVNSTEQSSREALSRKEESQSISKEEASKRQAEQQSLEESKKQQESEDESKKATSASLSAKIKEMTTSGQTETVGYTKEDYKNMIIAAGESQRKYIETFPPDAQSGLQTPFSARVAEYTRLLGAYPEDQALIKQAFQEIDGEQNDELSNIHTVETDMIYPHQIMEEYADMMGQFYLPATPLIVRSYYGYEVPDELLSMTYLDGSQISFDFYRYTIGEGPRYELMDVYVNTEGTEVILFVKKDGVPMVLESTMPPENDLFTVTISHNEILNQFLQ